MAKRKVKKGIKNIFLFVLLIIIIGGSFIYFNNKSNESNDSTNIPKSNIKKKAEDEVYKIKLLATGDGIIHNAIFLNYLQSDGSYDFSNALSEVKDIVSDYDIAYYNQETPFGIKESVACNNDYKNTGWCGYPRFNTPSEFGTAMIDAGFNTVSLASNHSLDAGQRGILNTVKFYSVSDCLYDGMNETEERQYIIKEKNNITYTMLSYTTSTNGLNVPEGKDYLLNVYSEELVKKDIEAIRDSVDVLIVAMHWGQEYQTTPNDEQKEIAKYLADLGVDIVIGNHPHVLQPITKIDKTIVMYSLGNFISNQYGTDDYNKLVGFMATLDITKTIKPDGSATIDFSNLGGELIFTKYEGDPITTANHTGHQVIPFSKMHDNTYLKDYERLYTKYSNVLTSMGTDLEIVPLGSKN